VDCSKSDAPHSPTASGLTAPPIFKIRKDGVLHFGLTGTDRGPSSKSILIALPSNRYLEPFLPDRAAGEYEVLCGMLQPEPLTGTPARAHVLGRPGNVYLVHSLMLSR
jgi:hypothetical protein